MNTIKVEWRKQVSEEVQFLPNRQYSQQSSSEKPYEQEKNVKKKKVRFMCPTPIAMSQAFENINDDSEDTIQSNKSLSNIFTEK